MNDVLQQLKDRKSVRVFEDRPISPEVRQALLESALEAPTAGNMLLYTIIDVTDGAAKAELAELCDGQSFIADAPLVLVFVADWRRWYDTFEAGGLKPRKPGVGDMYLALNDAVIAAQNTVVAAHSMGLGSCYIGDVIEGCERMRGLLNLPEYTLPACMLVYGYPTSQQVARTKPKRFGMDRIVHANAYRPMDSTELLAMYGDRNPSTTLEAFFNRKYMSDFALEMNRSMGEYIKSFERGE